MEILNLCQELSGNTYPGRGIVIGKNPAGTHAMIAYFIMGRSVNSRNRVFELDEDGIGMHTKAYDPALLKDPSLVIYSPVSVIQNDVIVTNGDQTDTIAAYLSNGRTFQEALRTRTFEPDPPNYTPRISGILHLGKGGFTYQMSILKCFNGDETQPQKFFFDFTSKSGLGHFIHTYQSDGDPRIPSFEGEPKPVALDGNIDTFADEIWNALNEDNKVSLFTRFINLQDGSVDTRIINKHEN